MAQSSRSPSIENTDGMTAYKVYLFHRDPVTGAQSAAGEPVVLARRMEWALVYALLKEDVNLDNIQHYDCVIKPIPDSAHLFKEYK